ncbi:MAG TPA: NIPSNAP family protein [Stellaceae bacterium]|nr:NIPSNAP family protein [Stellaceae bacterium]
MLTLSIRYTLDANKLAEFEAYAKALARPLERCGGKLVAYYLPTKIAGPTNQALGLIDFTDLASYERYRANLLRDEEAAACLKRVEEVGAILVEDRAFIRRVGAS